MTQHTHHLPALDGVGGDERPSPRRDAIRDHFTEWHGVAPDDVEIAALLDRIDGAMK